VSYQSLAQKFEAGLHYTDPVQKKKRKEKKKERKKEGRKEGRKEERKDKKTLFLEKSIN
jgi:hypothetical protein